MNRKHFEKISMDISLLIFATIFHVILDPKATIPILAIPGTVYALICLANSYLPTDLQYIVIPIAIAINLGLYKVNAKLANIILILPIILSIWVIAALNFSDWQPFVLTSVFMISILLYNSLFN